MRDLLSVYKAIEFIEAHLCEDVTVAGMAEAAGYSLYHFIRIFSQVVRHTPHDYLMRRRMTEAAHQLVTSNQRVLEIAIDYRFNNHESFSRAFKRFFGMQPVLWRERGILPHRVLMPAFTYSYLEHIHQHGCGFPQQIGCHQRRLAGLMTPLKSQPEEVTDIWRFLEDLMVSNRLAVQSASFFGVTCYYDGQDGRSTYFAGYESESLESGPLLASLTLPAGEYIWLAHDAPLAAIPHSWDYLYHTWLPKAGLQPAFPIEVAAFGTAPPWLEMPVEAVLSLPVKKADDRG